VIVTGRGQLCRPESRTLPIVILKKKKKIKKRYNIILLGCPLGRTLNRWGRLYSLSQTERDSDTHLNIIRLSERPSYAISGLCDKQ
jgi:hypothetical protein